MKPRPPCLVLAVFVVSASLFSFCGCGGGGDLQPREPSDAERNLARFGLLYFDYRATQRAAPATLDQLTSYAKNLDKAKLAKMKITDVAQAFVSPRDNQRYELAPGPRTAIVAYEGSGEKGKRYVLTGNGAVVEMEEEAIQELCKLGSHGGAPRAGGK
jgi:hypothetical protein